jgi:hypothetical protein
LAISHDELREVFDKTVNQILVFLTTRIDGIPTLGHNTAKLILLVGGFGSNVYLLQRIQEQFPSCKVIQPPES